MNTQLNRDLADGCDHTQWTDESGDVPGWVLVTLMTAGLVTVIWALASDRLTALFEQAMNNVVP